MLASHDERGPGANREQTLFPSFSQSNAIHFIPDPRFLSTNGVYSRHTDLG